MRDQASEACVTSQKCATDEEHKRPPVILSASLSPKAQEETDAKLAAELARGVPQDLRLHMRSPSGDMPQ